MRTMRLAELEYDIMTLLWQTGKLHTGEILEQLQDKKRCIQALQSVMKRLELKKAVTRTKIGRLNYYEPLISAEDYKKTQLKTMIEEIYDNSPGQLIATLVSDYKLTEQEYHKIKMLLLEFEDD